MAAHHEHAHGGESSVKKQSTEEKKTAADVNGIEHEENAEGIHLGRVIYVFETAEAGTSCDTDNGNSSAKTSAEVSASPKSFNRSGSMSSVTNSVVTPAEMLRETKNDAVNAVHQQSRQGQNSYHSIERIFRPAPFYYYVDRSREATNDSICSSNFPNTFVYKMHEILSRKELEGIVCWSGHGRAWKIIDVNLFQNKVLPQFFSARKLSSFFRSVRGWGFKKMKNGQDCGAFYNEFFLRGLPQLSARMTRKKSEETNMIMSTGFEPDLAQISLIHPLPSLKDENFHSQLSNTFPRVTNESEAIVPSTDNLEIQLRSNSINQTMNAKSSAIHPTPRIEGNISRCHMTLQNPAQNQQQSGMYVAIGASNHIQHQYPQFQSVQPQNHQVQNCLQTLSVGHSFLEGILLSFGINAPHSSGDSAMRTICGIALAGVGCVEPGVNQTDTGAQYTRSCVQPPSYQLLQHLSSLVKTDSGNIVTILLEAFALGCCYGAGNAIMNDSRS